MMVSKRNLLFQGIIFRCHVSFREGTLRPQNCMVVRGQKILHMFFCLPGLRIFKQNSSRCRCEKGQTKAPLTVCSFRKKKQAKMTSSWICLAMIFWLNSNKQHETFGISSFPPCHVGDMLVAISPVFRSMSQPNCGKFCGKKSLKAKVQALVSREGQLQKNFVQNRHQMVFECF